ncbi:MAG: hypothetical protein U0270_45360 [Labilithrix sp.]
MGDLRVVADDGPGLPDAGAGDDSNATSSGASSSGSSSSSSGSRGDGGDPLQNGNGGLGVVDLKSPTVVNAYAALAADVKAGSATITLDTADAFDATSTVLVWQSAGLPPPPSGDASPVDLASGPVGAFELAIVTAKQGTMLTLARPLTQSYTSSSTQVVLVPNYQELTIEASADIHALPWNGRSGGIVAFLVAGRLRNEGLIDADGAGSRGARAFTRAGGSLTSCPGIDGAPSGGYGVKGEGVATAAFSPLGGPDAIGGRGNVANGGGGGQCHNAGGGGGGHAGAGGHGGRSGTFTSESEVGGLGGAPLMYEPSTRLAFGGGGGSGDADSTTGDPAVEGGSGGGVVFVRAASFDGAGTITANGRSAASLAGNGGGGGGAGGLVSVDVTGAASCTGLLRASGGAGSTIDGSALGTTGGGGGGRVVLRAQVAAPTCKLEALGGAAGVQNDVGATGGAAHGATGGGPGVTLTVLR